MQFQLRFDSLPYLYLQGVSLISAHMSYVCYYKN